MIRPRRLVAVLATAIIAAIAAVAPSVKAQSGTPSGLPAVTAADHVLGRADAPVTVVEYASFTCPHCAAFHNDVLPAFKARYIDTGKVRLIHRNLPTAPANVAAAAAAVALCAAPGKYFDVAAAFMRNQAALPTTGAAPWFEAGIAASGRTRDEMETCLETPASRETLEAQIDGARAAGVTGTPSFFVDGAKVADPTLDGLAAVIDPLLRR